MKRLVILSPNWLGDAVMALPAIADVRRASPDASITVAARAAIEPLFQLVPEVDGTIVLSKAPSRHDVARWRALPQPSYDLDKRNCVHFVAELAASLGMRVELPKKLVKKPKSFLNLVAETNRAWLTERKAVFYPVK